MANYSLTINSKFKPFSYQELLAPALMATQAHQAVEDAYSTLGMSAEEWGSKLNAQTDRESYEKYQAYTTALEKQAEELAKYGLNPSSRQNMLNMRTRYAKDINPIAEAWNRRNEQIKQEAELLAKDPTHLFARRASLTSVDDYVRDTALNTLNESYSGALLTQQVSQAAAALAKNAREDRGVQTQLRKLLPYQYETIRQNGFKPEEVLAAIQGSESASAELLNIVNTAMANSGMNDWNYMSPEDKQRVLTQARQYANQGLWSAVGQTQYGQVTDQAGLTQLQYDLQDRNAVRAHNRQNPELAKYSSVQLKGNPVNIYSPSELTQQAKQIEQYKKYFTKEGKLTEAGLKEYYRTNLEGGVPGSTTPGKQRPSDFKVLIDNLNGGKPVNPQSGTRSVNTVNNLWKGFVNQYKSYDAKRATEYIYNFHGSEGEHAFNTLQRKADSEGKVRVSTWNGDEFVEDGTKVKITDLSMGASGNVVGVEGRYGKHGNFLLIKMKDGTEYRVDAGVVNPSSNQNVRDRIAGALKSQSIITPENAFAPIIWNGISTTRQDMLNYQLNQAYDAFGTIWGDATVEPVKVQQGMH